MALGLYVGAAASTTSCGGSAPPVIVATATPTSTAVPICVAIGKGTYSATCKASRSVVHFGADVDAAIDALVASKPQIFDLNKERPKGSRQYLVVDKQAFFKGVVANLNAAGVCAEADIFNDHRIKVKNTADYSEDYLITDLGGFVQRSPGSYDQGCTPSAFPLDLDPKRPPPDQGCGEPYPPQITHFGVHVEIQALDFWTLDSTPQVDDVNYCAAIGYIDGRSRCPLRPEGDPERVACEGWRVGIAKDSGRLGPTWTRDGKYCTGPASGCDNAADNQFQLWVYQGDGSPHTYRVCAEGSDACGELLLDH
jgi:hypothetical protein